MESVGREGGGEGKGRRKRHRQTTKHKAWKAGRIASTEEAKIKGKKSRPKKEKNARSNGKKRNLPRIHQHLQERSELKSKCQEGEHAKRKPNTLRKLKL